METMASAAVAATLTLPIDLIIVVSQGGKMSRLVSKYRPAVPIFACTTDFLVVKHLGVVRGVIPMEVKEDQCNPAALIAKA
jgi:pyruvate kinase